MARWRLIEPHYLKVKGVTWEYQETDRATGRMTRKSFPVPQYFHPDVEADWTERTGNLGLVVVSNGNNAQPSDVVWDGEPTPGMLALDKEAEEISARYKDRWEAPNRVYEEAENSYAGRMMDRYVESQGKVNMMLAEATSREVPGMGDVMKAMTDMMQQNQKIMMMLAEKSIAAELGIKPEVDNLEPLDPLDKFKKRA